jgi:hypothetical protein
MFVDTHTFGSVSKHCHCGGEEIVLVCGFLVACTAACVLSTIVDGVGVGEGVRNVQRGRGTPSVSRREAL